MRRPDEDESRMIVAAHEMGHAVVWRRLGFRVGGIVIRGRGRKAQGWVDLEDMSFTGTRDVEQLRRFLAGLVIGWSTVERWCDQQRLRVPDFGMRFDAEQYVHWTTHHPLGRQIDRGDVQRFGERTLGEVWSLVERHAPTLYERGSFNL